MSSHPAADENSLNPSDVRRLTERALLFHRHIFKKTWGIYYALWACAFTIYIFVPPLLETLGLPSNFANGYPLVAVDLVVSATVGIATGRLLERARRSAFVHSVLRSPKDAFYKKWFGAWWIAYITAIIVSVFFFGVDLLSVAFGLATTVTPVFYYLLKSSFPEKLPAEGILAIFFFGFATSASFALSFFPLNYLAYGIIWGATILVWFGASIVSLLNVNKEIVEVTEVQDR
jgi:hypothetical protein